jgi:hypothetical protein
MTISSVSSPTAPMTEAHQSSPSATLKRDRNSDPDRSGVEAKRADSIKVAGSQYSLDIKV